MRNVCFFGDRDAEHTQKPENRLVDVLEELIRQGAPDFYAGGERGFELIGECAVLMLKTDYPHLRLHLIYPGPEVTYPKDWKFMDFVLYRRIAECAATKEECDGFEERDRKILEYADCCVCLCDESCSGKIVQTVRMAREKGIKVIDLHK